MAPPDLRPALRDEAGTFKGGYFDLARPYESEGLGPRAPGAGAGGALPAAARDERRPQRPGDRRAAARACPSPSCNTWSHMILKPPHVGGPLPWHQDEAYWDTGFAYRALGCWVPLDPATVESGCMHFLPGSHVGPVRPHRHIDDDPNVHGLVDRGGRRHRRASPVPLAPGGATFHHCRTLHMTTPNVSDHVRRAWATEIQVEPRAPPARRAARLPLGARSRAGLEEPQARLAIERCGVSDRMGHANVRSGGDGGHPHAPRLARACAREPRRCELRCERHRPLHGRRRRADDHVPPRLPFADALERSEQRTPRRSVPGWDDFEYQATILGAGTVTYGSASGEIETDASATPEFVAPGVGNPNGPVSNQDSSTVDAVMQLAFQEDGVVTGGVAGTPVVLTLNFSIQSVGTLIGGHPSFGPLGLSSTAASSTRASVARASNGPSSAASLRPPTSPPRWAACSASRAVSCSGWRASPATRRRSPASSPSSRVR